MNDKEEIILLFQAEKIEFSEINECNQFIDFKINGNYVFSINTFLNMTYRGEAPLITSWNGVLTFSYHKKSFNEQE